MEIDKDLNQKSQYRSHGYLFNQYCLYQEKVRKCLNTVLTVISLINFNRDGGSDCNLSQYRSHGYLFNLENLLSYVLEIGLNTVLTVISLINVLEGTRD